MSTYRLWPSILGTGSSNSHDGVGTRDIDAVVAKDSALELAQATSCWQLDLLEVSSIRDGVKADETIVDVSKPDLVLAMLAFYAILQKRLVY